MATWAYSTTFKRPMTGDPPYHVPDQPVAEPLSPVLHPVQDTPYQRFVNQFRLGNPAKQAFGTTQPYVPRTWKISTNNGYPTEGARRRSSLDKLAQVASHSDRSPTEYTGYSSRPYDSSRSSESRPPSSHHWQSMTAYAPQTPASDLELANILVSLSAQPVPTARRVSNESKRIQHRGSQEYGYNYPRTSQLPAVGAYLPSPQQTLEDAKYRQAFVQPDSVSPMEVLQHDEIPIEQQSYIQTPPDDDLQGTPNRDEDEDTMDERPRARRGWPKGKPRGPRKSAASSGVTKSKTTTGKRSRKGAAAKAADTVLTPPRRKSLADLVASITIPDVSPVRRPSSVPPGCRFVPGKPKSNAGRKPLPKFTKETVCEHCNTARESLTGELDNWISCNGCKKWFHSDCAGFSSERELRDVDKFFCTLCEPKHGATTFVRKSNRAHTAVDYAGLNQGVLKTSDDCHEHHYIQPIKDGTLFQFDPESFPRMPPELVTAEYFERSACFNQPILIPAALNPKPAIRQKHRREAQRSSGVTSEQAPVNDDVMLDEFEYDVVHDDGQDRLDMVIPQNLTIRDVCNLVGPEYPLDVIDVKVQGTESARWNLGKWADYYEMDGEKAIRNVISLEVSDTKLGRLLRRPKIVRQIDLQDNVWPSEEPYKSVAFYCLMSVQDSYTDFHVDFGGSSVYYHILRGSKTFFFIPPKPKHLKAYEDWNDSHEQNYTFLPNTTKECYRVDLFEGDTMLIPSGWIHAVWTPSNSLVIGGNFLTSMHYGMQFRIVEVEKANKTPTKFRYPKFQKVMWYAVIKYLKEDPLPQEVRETFYSGQRFERTLPSWQEFDHCGDPAEKGMESYHARYYSQMELDGLPELVSFIFRTVMISLDRIEGVTVETRRNVTASIPKGYGDPLELAKTFALWVAWKRGNEDPPAFAQPDFGLPDKEGVEPKRMSTKMMRQKQRQEAFEAYKMAPERQSARQKQQESVKAATTTQGPQSESPQADVKFKAVLGPRRVACDACRHRRIRCKHKDEVAADQQVAGPSTPSQPGARRLSREMHSVVINRAFASTKSTPASKVNLHGAIASTPMSAGSMTMSFANSSHVDDDGGNKRPRTKACAECRKSKRRCIHDENGNIDPMKEQQAPIPRGSVTKKRKHTGEELPDSKRTKVEPDTSELAQTVQVPAPSQIAEGGPAPVDSPIDPQLTGTTNHEGLEGQNASFADFAAQALDYSNEVAVEEDETELGEQQILAELTAAASAGAAEADGSTEMETDPVQEEDTNNEEEARAVEETSDEALEDSRHDSASEVGLDVAAAVKDVLETKEALVADEQNNDELGPAGESGEPGSAEQGPTVREVTPPSRSPLPPVSSPLSVAAASPEPTAKAPQPAPQATSRQSSRAARPIERFSASQFEGSLLSKPAKATMTPTIPAPRSHKRKLDDEHSVMSPSPTKKARTPAPPRQQPRRSKESSSPREARSSKTPQPGLVKFEMSPEEEDSRRLARELQAESFGLRRRSIVDI